MMLTETTPQLREPMAQRSDGFRSDSSLAAVDSYTKAELEADRDGLRAAEGIGRGVLYGAAIWIALAVLVLLIV